MRLEEELLIRRDRPSMISAKYRAREERRRFLKISAGKLRRIEDPEASLCRSVLINNAVRRLQRENRDEKSRNYALSVNFLHDGVKVNDDASNINGTIDDTTSNKRFEFSIILHVFKLAPLSYQNSQTLFKFCINFFHNVIDLFPKFKL